MERSTTALIGYEPTISERRVRTGAHPTIVDGRYEILSVLGEGGHGIVYRARQRSTGQSVAIKVLRPNAITDADIAIAVARFEREMRLIARLSHPHIVRLIDSGRLADDSIYTVLELIEGESLAGVLSREGTLAPREAKRLLGQVLDALSCAHRIGVVHRDLKPENIMVTTTGARRNAMVLDFGIATVVEEARASDYRSLTAEGQINGTPHYMAPEQLLGELPTPQTDLYAWGLILAEALIGAPVVDGSTLISIISRQISREPIAVPLALRESPLGEIIERAVAKPLEDRFQTADEVLETLEATYLGDETGPRMAAPGPLASGSMPAMTARIGDAAPQSNPWLEVRDLGRALGDASSSGVRAALDSLKDAERRWGKYEIVGLLVTGAMLLVVGVCAIAWASRDTTSEATTALASGERASQDDPSRAPPSLAATKADGLELEEDDDDSNSPIAAAEDELTTPSPPPPVPTKPQLPAPVKPEGTRGNEMVWFEAGLFEMGLGDDDMRTLERLCSSPEGASAQTATFGRAVACDRGRWENQRPSHMRDTPSFYLDLTEVTNADYEACVADGSCAEINVSRCELIGKAGTFSKRRVTRKRRAAVALRVRAPELPAACVNRVEAATYCHWAGKRLPTEAEWEFAASAGGTELFPWANDGETDTMKHANGADQSLAVVMSWTEGLAGAVASHRDAYAFAAPTRSFPEGRSADGLWDLAGNVAEWVSDPFAPFGTTTPPRTNVRTGLVRGGGWADFGPDLSTRSRRAVAAGTRRADIGFRCAKSAAP